jgi:SAM-dependent methyltransferase
VIRGGTKLGLKPPGGRAPGAGCERHTKGGVKTQGLARKVLPRRLKPAVLAVRKRINLAKGLRGRDRALAREVAFWEGWFDRSDANIAERLDRAVTDLAVLSCLSRIDRKQVSIIDVGAGPLSTLGTQAPGKQLSLVAVDPLAAEYARLLDERGIMPLVQTQFGAGENLLEQFEPESFDIAFAENTLDHTADPCTIIENMIALVRKGGFVVLIHNENEAENAAYADLHQWNFQQRDGTCVIWRPGRQVDLRRVGGSLECWTERPNRPRVVCVIERSDRFAKVTSPSGDDRSLRNAP